MIFHHPFSNIPDNSPFPHSPLHSSWPQIRNPYTPVPEAQPVPQKKKIQLRTISTLNIYFTTHVYGSLIGCSSASSMTHMPLNVVYFQLKRYVDLMIGAQITRVMGFIQVSFKTHYLFKILIQRLIIVRRKYLKLFYFWELKIITYSMPNTSTVKFYLFWGTIISGESDESSCYPYFHGIHVWEKMLASVFHLDISKELDSLSPPRDHILEVSFLTLRTCLKDRLPFQV